MCIKSLEDVAENMTEHELQYQDGTMPVSCQHYHRVVLR